MPALGNRPPNFSAVYKTVNDLPIPLDVFLPPTPPSDGSGPAPIVFYIHGGCLVASDSSDIPRFLPVFCARDSYVLVSVNYRLAPQAHLADAFQDVRDALVWCEKELPALAGVGGWRVDPARVALVGDSIGAWLALLIGNERLPFVRVLAALYPMTNLTDEQYKHPAPVPPTPRAAVAAYIEGPCVSGWVNDIDYSLDPPPPPTGRSLMVNYMAQEGKPRISLWTQWIIGAEPDQVTEIEKWDVRKMITPGTWSVPTAVMHGDSDKYISPTNGAELASALHRAGVKSFYRSVLKANHWFDILADPADAALMDALSITPMWNFLRENL
ncbi:alpha/beta-hydrolase [Auriscalpium vulgare]|uniref:Alpha/beta-hydrolase n=1 Tax=Auriscalpium vulgare TaxID=40419 RepID=A0ACB8RJE2_9AGAM|nr:alpha/beta-hydrolase [Auriscalpium vulgare]